MVAGFIGSLNVTVTFVSAATSVALAEGLRPVIVGAVVSAGGSSVSKTTSTQ
jgi:hypothetical protein